MPTDDTAVFPPGIGTSDASVEMMMLSDSSVQKLIEPPKASMQHDVDAGVHHRVDRVAAEEQHDASRRAHRLPQRRRRGLRGWHHEVAQLRDAEHEADPTITASTMHQQHQGDELLGVDRIDVDRRSGESTIATPSSMIWATMLPTLISSPPDATADARSTPCFCRKRICAAMPPIAGTARFENDIDSCSSAVRISGRLIGTVPMSATAVAKLVSSETIMAMISQTEVGAGDGVPQLLRAPDLAQEGEDGDERADRHHQVGAADPVELLQRRLVGAGRGGRGGAHATPPASSAPCGACDRGGGRGSARPVAGRGARR